MIIGRKISSDMFSYNAATKSFCAEASYIYGFNGRLYDDSADAGFVMVSIKTGAELVFWVDGEHRDYEGDITHWTLSSCDRVFSITVFND